MGNSPAKCFRFDWRARFPRLKRTDRRVSGEDKAKASDAGVKPLSGLIPFDALVPLRLRANRLPVTNRTSPVTVFVGERLASLTA
jgi:hypothetical protein